MVALASGCSCQRIASSPNCHTTGVLSHEIIIRQVSTSGSSSHVHPIVIICKFSSDQHCRKRLAEAVNIMSACACREAVSDPGTTVLMNPKMENLMESYRKYGRNGRFVTSSTVDRSRGPRFEMPSPGMKTISAIEIILTWWLATIYV